ncbi:MAG: hypothetical protein KC593_17650 [Myxococcales bacterium]|nr:hypothetical protein [Myxococcales bacterium]MCB9627928.1 hypothetical protein [Sandaracinaceae bacterium]
MRRREFLSWSMVGAGAGALGLVTPGRVLAGACAPPSFAPVYRTPPGTSIGPGGAIVVGADLQFGGGEADPFADTYTLSVAGVRVRLRIERWAPGVLRLIPLSPVTGAGVVRGGAGELAVSLVSTPAVAPAPCHVTRARIQRYEGSSEPYSPPTWSLQAHLRAALPQSVLGVAVAPAAAGSAYGAFEPRSGDRVQRLYQSPGRCQMDVPGANPPAPGQRIRVACLGVNGAVSVRSNDVEVRD